MKKNLCYYKTLNVVTSVKSILQCSKAHDTCLTLHTFYTSVS